jgi:hypothetical protein
MDIQHGVGKFMEIVIGQILVIVGVGGLPRRSNPNELNKVLAKFLLESHFSILATHLFGYTPKQTLSIFFFYIPFNIFFFLPRVIFFTKLKVTQSYFLHHTLVFTTYPFLHHLHPNLHPIPKIPRYKT